MGKNSGVTNSRWSACFQAIWTGIRETLSSSVLRSILFSVKQTACKFPVKNLCAAALPDAALSASFRMRRRSADRRAGGRPLRNLLSIRALRSLKKQDLRCPPGVFCRLPPRPDTLFLEFHERDSSAGMAVELVAGAAIEPAAGCSFRGMDGSFKCVFTLHCLLWTPGWSAFSQRNSQRAAAGAGGEG